MNTIPLADVPVAAPAPTRTITRRTVLATGIGLAGVIGLAIVGGRWWVDGRFLENTDDAYVGGDITVISPKVPGYIATVMVADNQPVHAGDLLLKLDDRDYQAALARADGAVAAQQALINNLDATRTLQQAVIAQAHADVASAAAEVIHARDNQARYARLLGTAYVSAESAQKADTDYQQAMAGSQRAAAALQAAEEEVAVIATRRQQAEAALMQAQADRDVARLNLSYTELRAPIDGVVGNRHAHNGAYAAAASQQLSIVPAQGLWVDANFKENQLAHFHPGQSATVEADVLPGHRFHGHVISLAPATGAQFSVLPPENATGNFTKIVQRVPVRIQLDSGDGADALLRPGLSVTAEIDTRESQDARP